MDLNKILNPGNKKLHDDPEVDALLKKLYEKGVIPLITVDIKKDANGNLEPNSSAEVIAHGPSAWIAMNIYEVVENHPQIKEGLMAVAITKGLREKVESLIKEHHQSSQEGVDLFDLSKYDVDKNKPN